MKIVRKRRTAWLRAAGALVVAVPLLFASQPAHASLGPALTPSFSVPVATADGFTVDVTNWDQDWTWTQSVSSGFISAGLASGSTLPLTVTGLSPDGYATVTVDTARAGYDDGSGNVSANALRAPLVPTFGTPTRTADGFTVDVTNWNPSWTWYSSVDAGSVSAGSGGSGLTLTVTGLGAGDSATVTVETARPGYADGSATESGTALSAPLVPAFGTASRTTDGFIIQVTNWDPSWTWTASVDAGSVSAGTGSGSTLTLTVTGLIADQTATVTVETAKTGYADGSATESATALSAPLVPEFGTPTPTADGYTVEVTNWDQSWTWSSSVDIGSVSDDGGSGSTLTLTVTGLSPDQTATVTVETAQSGYADGSGIVSAAALSAPLVPVFGTPTPASGGFTVEVTNWDQSWTWASSVDTGSVSDDGGSGSTLTLTVTGVDPLQSATVSVSASRPGFVTGEDTVQGTAAIGTALTPVYGVPTRTTTGFTVDVTNWDPAWTWSAGTTAGSVTAGTASGSTLPLTVTGLAPGASATVSVDTARPNYQAGAATASSSAFLGSAPTPTFDAPVSLDGGFTVAVTNWDADWTWTPSVSAGSVSAGTAVGSRLPLTVTGLAGSALATVTVHVTRADYETASAAATGSANASSSGGGQAEPTPTPPASDPVPQPAQSDAGQQPSAAPATPATSDPVITTQPLRGPIATVSAEAAATTPPIRAARPPAESLSQAPVVRSQPGDVIRVGVTGLPPRQRVVVAIRIRGVWTRLGVSMTGALGGTTLPAFTTSRPGEYPLRMRAPGVPDTFVRVVAAN